MQTSDESYSPSLSISEKIDRAITLHSTRGPLLREDPTVDALIRRLNRNIETTRKTMLRLGIVAECKHCEEEEGGSCCGAGIENRYDEVLLLMNLLLGVPLPTLQQDQSSCYLLGKDGCTLMVRHVLCVNYLCSKLRDKLSHEELTRLQACAGEELDTGFILYETIKKRLRATP